MTREEIRKELLGPRRVETLTHGTLVFEVVVPLMSDVERAIRLSNERQRDAFLTWKCLRKEGVPVFDSLEEVLDLDAERSRLVDACAKKIREMIQPVVAAEPPKG